MIDLYILLNCMIRNWILKKLKTFSPMVKLFVSIYDKYSRSKMRLDMICYNIYIKTNIITTTSNAYPCQIIFKY